MWQIIVIISAAIAAYFIPTPQEMRNAFISGQNFYAARDYKKALQQYNLILETESAFLDEDSVVVQLLNNELKVSVKNAAAYQKANTLKQLEKGDSALMFFRQVALKKNEPEIAALAQFQVYDILYRFKRYDESIAQANILVQNFPENKKSEQALYDIGWAYREIGNIDSSTYSFRRLLSAYPNTDYYARALYQIAQNEFEQGKYSRAIADWKNLIEKFRPSVFTEKDWEKVEIKAERERKIFEATQERDVESSDLELVAKAYVKVGDSYSKLSEFDEAIKSYRTIITTYTLLPSLQEICWIKIAEATHNQRGVSEAVDVYKEAIDANFNNKKLQTKMQYKIAEMYQNERMYLQAADAFDFYINSFGETADMIGFGADKAKLSMIAALYNGKAFEKTVSHSDSFLVKYGSSDFVPSVLFLRGSAQLAMRDYSNAKISFTKLIDEYPKSDDIVNANIQLGFINYKEGNLEKALQNYMSILENYPDRIDSSEVYYNLLLVYSDLKRDNDAIEAFNHVKFGSSYYTSAFGKIIKIYGNTGQYERGDSLLKAITEKDFKADSVNYSPYINFASADLAIAKRDYNSAVNFLTRVITDSSITDTNNTLVLQSYYARGILNFQIQHYNDAINDLDKLLNNPVFISGFSYLVPNSKEKLALSLAKVGKLDESIKLINEFLLTAKNISDSAKVNLIISNLYYEAKDYKKSIELAQPILSLKNIDTSITVGAYISLSNSYKGLGDMNKSGELLLEASQKYPTSEEIPQVLFSLGGLYFDNQQFDKSAEIFTKFNTLFPDHMMKREALYYLAFSYFQSGKWENSAKVFKEFVSIFPDDKAAPEFQHYAGESYFNDKNFAKAIAEYQTTYRKYPNSDFAPMAMYNEGWCYFQNKEFDKMIEIFQRLSTRYPQSPYAGNALFTIGDHYYNKRDYAKATESYENLVKRFPNYERAEEAKALIKELSQINSYLEYETAMKPFDAGNYSKAIEELNKVIAKYPNDEIVIACSLNIASAYSQLGESNKAYELFSKLKEKFENDPEQLEAYLFAKSHVEYIEAKRKMQISD